MIYLRPSRLTSGTPRLHSILSDAGVSLLDDYVSRLIQQREEHTPFRLLIESTAGTELSASGVQSTTLLLRVYGHDGTDLTSLVSDSLHPRWGLSHINESGTRIESSLLVSGMSLVVQHSDLPAWRADYKVSTTAGAVVRAIGRTIPAVDLQALDRITLEESKRIEDISVLHDSVVGIRGVRSEVAGLYNLQPRIDPSRKTWMVYDADKRQVVDTGVVAVGTKGVDSHSLVLNTYMSGIYNDTKTAGVKHHLQIYYDGVEISASQASVLYRYRGGRSDQQAWSLWKIEPINWVDSTSRDRTALEVETKVVYRGLTATSYCRLDCSVKGDTPNLRLNEQHQLVADGKLVSSTVLKGDKGDPGKSVSIEDLGIRWQDDKLQIAGKLSDSLRGQQGATGSPGAPGKDGHTPVLTLNAQHQLVADGKLVSSTVLKGDRGDKGATGAKGDPGKSVTVADLGIRWQGDKLLVAGKLSDSLKGDPGDKGDTGAKGDPGKSVSIEDLGIRWQGDKLQIAGKLSDSLRGQQGAAGAKGDPGKSVSIEDLGIRWQGDKLQIAGKLSDSLRGGQGATGAPGAPGKDGKSVSIEDLGIRWQDDKLQIAGKLSDSLRGQQGATGSPGAPGKDGHTPVLTLNAQHQLVADGKLVSSTVLKGDRGDKGATGAKGDPGKSVTVADLGIRWQGDKLLVAGKLSDSLRGQQGATGSPGAPGKDGHTPVLTLNAQHQLVADGKLVSSTVLKGDRGDKGATGAKGDPGKDGKSVTVSEVVGSTEFQTTVKGFAVSPKDFADEMQQLKAASEGIFEMINRKREVAIDRYGVATIGVKTCPTALNKVYKYFGSSTLKCYQGLYTVQLATKQDLNSRLTRSDADARYATKSDLNSRALREDRHLWDFYNTHGLTATNSSRYQRYVPKHNSYTLIRKPSGYTRSDKAVIDVFLTDSGIRVGDVFRLDARWDEAGLYINKPGGHYFYDISAGVQETGYLYEFLRIGATEWIVNKIKNK